MNNPNKALLIHHLAWSTWWDLQMSELLTMIQCGCQRQQ